MVPLSPWALVASFILLTTPNPSAAQSSSASVVVSPTCTADSAANPIASIYPQSVTGTINGTMVVLPISYNLARTIIPRQYKILSGYKTLIPKLESDLYPLVMETTVDHEVQLQGLGFTLPDFSSVRFSFPFVDLLGDGYSNFRYVPTQFLSPNPITVGGAEAYGIEVVNSSFDPSCAGYAYISDKCGSGKSEHGDKDHDDDDDHGKIYFDAYSIRDAAQKSALVSATFEACGDGEAPYSINFFQNVTNQPIFADGKSCDNMIRFFNTSITTGRNAPEPIRGLVMLNSADVLPSPMTFRSAYGYKLDTAFIENNNVSCESLKGYGG